jgi:UDP-glucose 4-epimerase
MVKKKILITGSSGYIGSHLCEMLGEQYEVHGLDVVDPHVPLNEFYRCDIRKPFLVPGDIEFDAVVHLAALVRVGESEQKPISYYITNLNGTMNVVNKIKTKNFIFASTGAAQDCKSAYGISKRAAEDVVREFCTNHRETPYTIFRFYNVIGSTVVAPTNPDGLMYNLMKARETGEFTVFGTDYERTSDGTCVRDYVHVNEICDALKQAIEKPSNQIESLGHGVGYTVKEIVSLFQKVNDIDIDVKYGPRRKGDIDVSVLEDVSPYMRNLYTIEELLKVQRL